jgi:hypothetical protein
MGIKYNRKWASNTIENGHQIPLKMGIKHHRKWASNTIENGHQIP